MRKLTIINKLFFLLLTLSLVSCSTLMQRPVDKQRAVLLLQKGADALTAKAYRPASVATKKALKIDPDNAAAYNQLALIYLETKRYSKSEQAFKKALTLRPVYPEVFNNFGVLYNRKGEYQKAISWFKKALSAPDYVTPENAYTNMGYAYSKLGKVKKAKRFHQQSLDISPTYCLGSKNLADVYAKERNYDKSITLYRSAVTHCPLFQEAQYKLGLALVKSGNKKMAKQQLRKLVSRHRRGEFVDRSQKILKYLGKVK